VTSDPLVSAVIPTHNYGEYVCAAVQSALAQTYPNLEVIVVDDGSTDDTRERLRVFGDKITYIYQDNKCVASARNTGVRAARGDWIAFLDSDDTWAKRKVELQMTAARMHGWQVVLCADPGARTAAAGPREVELSFEELLFARPGFGSCALVLKKCFDDVGLFDEWLTNAEDRDIMLRLGRRFKTGLLYEDCVHIRKHARQKSYHAARMERSHRRVVQKVSSWPEMRHRYALKARMRSCFYWDSGYNYFAQGDRWRALGRTLLSLAHYPLPTGRTFVREPLGRLKLALRLVAGDKVFMWLRGRLPPKARRSSTDPVGGEVHGSGD
jgi:glycosyltransferase involved in cell wall biosynthesis